MRSLRYRNKIGLGVLALALLNGSPGFAAGCPGADDEAIRWLDKMARSVHEVSYHGVVTFQRGGDDMQVMQVSHSVEDGSASESLIQLTGQGAKVVRSEHPLECLHPGHKLLRVSEEIRAGNCGVAAHYRFTVSDGERVAGRKAVRIVVSPADMYRYGYVLELDKRTGLLLKTETIGRGNKVLEKFQFADLSYRGRNPEGAEVNLVHEASHPLPQMLSLGQPPMAEHKPAIGPGTRVLQQGWAVNWLPRGFTATDSQPQTAGRKTFTDGLAVFSVFLEELDREIRPGEGVVNEGSTTSYSRGMSLADNPVLVTVVGEVPVNTARMVADSVKWAR
ncbi:negative regulator for alginate biosynthesis [Seongchinamella sediminis]|uniref:Negative regulator for alginate biosynthesis n=1 Tax=Seongchinamella sediminis TaxID=2283635 RepID=A0A3L7DXQ4_9GAMM|nr:MucB/RseB C-terminal domain-containing protein [Seongchinamella sediminis]RLQ21495.1 negative regulator for alginate biosynthesis [Seongchinamella sediminis]